ncbi:SO2930 family diheme c-type cytochrome [Algivirga pacifica]|uniref:Cytochrome c domain-containing protein n=1 Tax=Algivirga pacifica TaxID=1162670 RepID=A0ABP9DDL3_9BACT
MLATFRFNEMMIRSGKKGLLAGALALSLLGGCQKASNKNERPVAKKVEAMTLASTSHIGKETLSAYGFFKGNLSDLQPADRVYPYELNTPLFTDYAHKKRFIYVPEGKVINYEDKEALDFPEGSVLIKNFYYPNDFNNPELGKRIIETRLLIKEAKGWKALPYIWNKEQTEATLQVAGGETEVAWVHDNGENMVTNYIVPNMNQCKSCHVFGQDIAPLGPKARQLNRNNVYAEGEFNQLAYLAEKGVLKGLPEAHAIPKVAVWNDASTGTLDARARAYLDINCGHCHNPSGPAKTSGLDLTVFASTAMERGINKPPVAAGKGAGNLNYDIVPGHPEHSILLYRMESVDPGVMMPELGRGLVHKEGVSLIREWIEKMPMQ